MNSKDIQNRHKEFLFPAVANYYDDPLVLAQGRGCRLKDAGGRDFLDFFGGILTVSVGHCNPRVNRAVIDQMDRLVHTSTLYPTEPIVRLAEKLASIAPGQLRKSFFVASGTEADETAVMLAQVFTNRTEVIALRHGYSGRSMLGQALTAHAHYRAIPTQVAAIKHAPSPYCYRCPLRLDPASCHTACARDLSELIATTTTGRIAGMLVEPIQGVGGFITPPRDYLAIASEIVRRHGGVMIIDEVQTGFGRTGTMWGCQQFGVDPDIMTMAKGIANGLPLGAVTCTTEIADALTAGSISTFGGNPVCATAAVATIDVILEENLMTNAAERGAQLREGLLALQRANPAVIGDVRGMGLMQALELVVDETAHDRTPNPAATRRLFEETKKRGLLIGRGGLYGNTIRIAPPLTVTAAETDEAIRLLEESFAAL